MPRADAVHAPLARRHSRGGAASRRGTPHRRRTPEDQPGRDVLLALQNTADVDRLLPVPPFAGRSRTVDAELGAHRLFYRDFVRSAGCVAVGGRYRTRCRLRGRVVRAGHALPAPCAEDKDAKHQPGQAHREEPVGPRRVPKVGELPSRRRCPHGRSK